MTGNISPLRIMLVAACALRATGFSLLSARQPLRGSRAAANSRFTVQRSSTDDAEIETMKAEAAKLRAEVQELEVTLQSQKSDEMRSKSFNAFDVNGDGVVDLLELKTGLFDKFGVVCTDKELSSVVKLFDKNGDGVLQVDEFSVGQIKMKVEQLQDKARDEEAQARRAAEELAKPVSERVVEFIEDSPNEDAGFATRAASCVPYLLPLADGAVYGAYLLSAVPVLGVAIAPFVILLRAVPFGGLICFFIFSSQSRNPKLPVLLRFNLQQAILLDIALFFPSLAGLLPIPESISQSLQEPACDAVFLALMACIFYSWIGNLATGKAPNKIPFIGDTADKQIGGPFE